MAGNHTDEMITDHTKLLTQIDERSKSNVKTLDKHGEQIDTLFELHTALNSIETQIKFMAEKIDDIGVDKRLQAKRLELDEKKNAQLIKVLSTMGTKTVREKFEDALIPVILIAIIYTLLEAAKAGALG